MYYRIKNKNNILNNLTLAIGINKKRSIRITSKEKDESGAPIEGFKKMEDFVVTIYDDNYINAHPSLGIGWSLCVIS